MSPEILGLGIGNSDAYRHERSGNSLGLARVHLGSRSGRSGSNAQSVRDHRYPAAENRV
jgi:hypothetical protein